MDETTFGQWLKQRRKALDLSQNELAERVACSPVTIKKIESNERRPSKQILDLLMRELSIGPEERDRFISLARGISAGDSVAPAAGFPFLGQVMPLPPTPLIDRLDEITVIIGILRRPEVRLLTLSGPGGVGKTRLALQTAEALAHEFADGIQLIYLAHVTQPGLFLTAVAQALNFSASNEQALHQRLLNFFKDKQTLLVLDNFEQILPAAPEVASWLTALPKLKILVTSRARLRLTTEHEYAIPPMGLPNLKQLPSAEELSSISPAVDLFVQRVRAIRAGFRLTEQNARPVAEICSLLNGIPLAIELAAARCKVLEPPELLQRLKQFPALNLLTHGAQDLPARQQTIRQTIDWSYNLLEDSEKRLFERLGIFTGGATLEAIEAVCGEADAKILDGLTALIDQSLLWREEYPPLSPRFQMLATLHEYAQEHLAASGDLPLVQRKHAAYFAELADKAIPRLRTAEQVTALKELVAEHDNLRAALAWARSTPGEAQTGLRITAHLWEFWVMHGDFEEGYATIRRLLEQPGADAPTSWLAYSLLGLGLLGELRMEPTGPWYERSLELFRQLGDMLGEGWVLNQIAQDQMRCKSFEDGAALLRESIGLLEKQDAKWQLAWARHNLGYLGINHGQMALAEEQNALSLALFRSQGDQRGLAWALHARGNIFLIKGERAAALENFAESLRLLQLVEDTSSQSWIHYISGVVLMEMGELAQAGFSFQNSLRSYQRCGDAWGIAINLTGFARLALTGPQAERAAALLGAAEACFAQSPAALSAFENDILTAIRQSALGLLDERIYQAAWQAGNNAPAEQIKLVMMYLSFQNAERSRD